MYTSIPSKHTDECIYKMSYTLAFFCSWQCFNISYLSNQLVCTVNQNSSSQDPNIRLGEEKKDPNVVFDQVFFVI
uniref:Uncharacterized protein n=1 Tax=Arundo donax TaxID=35708 RepID=A0A0A9DWR0_ARUDO